MSRTSRCAEQAGICLSAVMDGNTRFIVPCGIHGNADKTRHDPAGLLEAAPNQAGRIPRILVTDGLKTSIKPAQSAFYRRSGPRFVHVREIHLQNHFNHNNKHERLNGEFKDGLKATRGLKDENSALIGLMIIHHNFFREHSAPGGRTPAEAAGITIEDTRKWETVIANAALSCA